MGSLGRPRPERPRCPVVPGYRNTEVASRHLASDGEYSLHGLVTRHDDHTWELFTRLEVAVRQGPNAAAGGKVEDPAQVLGLRAHTCPSHACVAKGPTGMAAARDLRPPTKPLPTTLVMGRSGEVTGWEGHGVGGGTTR